MNIDELVKQSTVEIGKTPRIVVQQVDYEKFARLVVEQCCDILMEFHEQSKLRHNYFHWAANRIKETMYDRPN